MKPWTTVDGSIATLTIPELCMMCDVHLIYLGNNKYGVATMTDCLNRGDKLAIYAMCDMLKQHAFVFTCTKPWTTVDGSITTLDNHPNYVCMFI